MSPEDQRIAIAWSAGHDKDLMPRLYPDYLNDLNAMHDVCVSLAKKGWRCVANMGLDGTWECFFTAQEEPSCIPGVHDHYGAGDTLAKALAEAYLRTIGKWKD